jgi:hypothetical protein
MSERGDRPEDDADEVTVWAGRLRAWPEPDAAEPESDTVLSGPRRRGDMEPADETVLGSRAAADDTVLGSRNPAPAPEDATRLRPAAEATRLRSSSRNDPPTDAEQPQGGVAPAAEPGRRAARIPAALDREVYGRRPAEPARITRTPPTRRAPQDPVADAGVTGVRGRARRRRILVTGVIVAVAVASAVAALVVLVLAQG